MSAHVVVNDQLEKYSLFNLYFLSHQDRNFPTFVVHVSFVTISDFVITCGPIPLHRFRFDMCKLFMYIFAIKYDLTEMVINRKALDCVAPWDCFVL